MANKWGPAANWQCLSGGGWAPSRAEQTPIGIHFTFVLSVVMDPGPFFPFILQKELFSGKHNWKVQNFRSAVNKSVDVAA